MKRVQIGGTIRADLAAKLGLEQNRSLVLDLALQEFYEHRGSLPQKKNWCAGCNSRVLGGGSYCPTCHIPLEAKP